MKNKVIPQQQLKLSLVIPCFNEKKRIHLLWDGLSSFVEEWKHDYEIIIIDDGSTDGVVDEIKNNTFIKEQTQKGKFQLLELNKNQGKGNALKEGALAATGTHILTMDADLSYDPKEVINWLNIRKEFNNHEIIIGSRLHKGSESVWINSEDASKNKKLRRFAGYLFNGFTKILTTIKVLDNQSGFKLYPAAVGKYLFSQMKNKGWAHDVELLYLADLNKIKLTEMPVRCVHRSGSKINVLTDSIKMFFQTLLISIAIRLKYYIIDPFKILLLGKNELIPPAPNLQKFKSEAAYRLLFSLMTIAMFILMPALSKGFAIAGDEWIQNEYGNEVFNYFFHGDPTAYQEIGRPQGYDNIIYYSGGYELFLVSISKLFPHSFIYDVRHFLVAITGAFLFLFSGLLGKRIGGWKVGFFALVFMICSPRLFGESMNNSKDIPFALGIIFTLYHMIPFLRDLPKPSWRSLLLIVLGIVFTLNIRSGALLLFAYLGLFTIIVYLVKLKKKEIVSFFNPEIKRLIIMLFVIFVLSYFLGLLTWPYALQNPLVNPIASIQEMANFSLSLRILFDGEAISSATIPWNYIPTWIGITSPEIILILFVLFIPFVYFIKNHFHNIFVYFLLFTVLFPVAYAIYKESALYDGWRHFLFIYPGIVICAALMIGFILDRTKQKVVKITVHVLVAVGLFFPVKSMFAVHPYEYLYFNDAYGGLPAAFKNFETDYYMTSAKEAFYTLAEKEDFHHLKDTVIVMSNMVKETTEYAKTVSPFVKVVYSKFENRIQQEYDYAIFFSRFLDLTLLKTNAWPPSSTYFTVSRQGVPLSIVLKNESKEDYLGTLSLKANDFQNAVHHFENYLKTDPNNEAVLYDLGSSYLALQQFDKAINAFEKSMKFYPNDQTTINLGLAYLNANNPKRAIEVLENGANKVRMEFDKYRNMALEDENNNMAFSYLQMHGEVLGAYYHYLSICYHNFGQPQQAQQYAEMAKQLNPRRQ